MDAVLLGIAASADKRSKENATAIENLKGGWRYKGAVADYAHLPSTGNKIGDVWTTLDDGNEYAWGAVDSVNQWIQIGGVVNPLTDAEIDYIVADKFSITATVVNATAAVNNPTEIADGFTATLTYTFDGSSYLCPSSSPVVTGATGVWTKVSDVQGTMVLSNATGAVSFTVEGEAIPVPIVGISCTVSGLGSSSPSSVTFTKDADFTKAGLGIEDVTVGTDVFVKIPTMYRKVNEAVGNQITSFTISNAQDTGFEPYSCFLDESGNTLPYILIGKYWNTSSNSCVSTTEAAAQNVTITNGRTYAQARGTGYQLFDWQIQKLWQDLIICFKETVNTNSGTAWTYDELGIYWTASSGWIDGVICSSGTWYLCDKPSKYASLAGTSDPIPADYVAASYAQPTTSGQDIQKLGYDSTHPFFNFPSETVDNSSYNTYYCDGYYYSSGNRPVYSRVGNARADNGAFYCRVNNDWSFTYGVRLCKKPL